MLKDSLKHLTSQGLQAVQAGSKLGAAAAADIEQQATAPELKDFLRRGNAQAKTWADRIAQAQQIVHGETAEQDNPIIKAHYEVSQRIVQHAQDSLERDLGIIAAGQLVLHYYIASFGTLASYMKQQDQTEAARLLKQCSDEAKHWDEEHTRLAEQMMSGAKQMASAAK
jgi:ferritin-like metal-binding protein YciE